MNQFLNQMERKFGRYAIPNLTRILIACYAIGYVLTLLFPSMLSFLSLEPRAILRGQIWRILSWIFIPPSSISRGFGVFLVVIMLFFYLSIGSSLERVWGTFRYNCYIFGGMLFTILAAFLSYFAFALLYGSNLQIGDFFSTYYITTSLFLAFAATFPDAEVRLYFVLPIRVKWLGLIYLAFLFYDVITYVRLIAAGHKYFFIPIIAMIAALLNFIIFVFGGKQIQRFRPAEIKRRRDFQASMKSGTEQFRNHMQQVEKRGSRHVCAVCGRTEQSDPDLEFRFCSKCEGNHEYCMEHLYTHRHILAKKENG